ncbi:site-specific integrase [Niveibacterium sp. 24ML]|uniref:tyrosine-type recombinase/integrase n=1 Tax=Niveibacterium sp. 24ML TaxID=2985512 RepID=UPI0022707FCA|nr:site-specific integrase [Niveibacterium sp. 24ML]MCX9154623.1 site-specific integrase [Niveibacterium sp. 24ML]
MAKVAEPFREGAGWSMRRRVMGQDLYVSGQKSRTAARDAMEALVSPLRDHGRPKGLGPQRTTVAQALQDMALERLPFMKGAAQEARRLNKYLEAAGLATLKVTRLASDDEAPAPGAQVQEARQHFQVELKPARAPRRVPNGLAAHRRQQAQETAAADALRARLASMPVADVQPYHVQTLMDELRRVRQPETVALERALLRGFFNYVKKVWCWSAPAKNPAVGLRMPKVDNARDRVMSQEEERRLDEAIQTCRNQLVGPTLTLLVETGMRTSEPLEHACWRDVNWEARILHLPDSKTDQRDVPLSPRAIEALQALAALNPPTPEGRIVRLTYDALAAAWRRACERAGLEDLRLYDLRHTAATRMALKTGNVFLVKALTGHKTMSQLERYVNVKASDVVAVMHAAPALAAAPQVAAAEPVARAPLKAMPRAAAVSFEDTVGNVIRADFGRRARE